MTKTQVKQQLKTTFTNLIAQTDVKSFKKYKNEFLSIMMGLKFYNYDTINMQIAVFEITCKNYLDSDFDTEFKKLLFGDFQMFVTSVHVALFD